MKKAILIAGSAFGLGVAGILSAAAFTPVAAAKAPAAQTKTATFAVEKMTCATCPITVKTAMQGVKGVKSVSVDFNAKTATVSFDPSLTNVRAIAAASTNAGYPASVKG